MISGMWHQFWEGFLLCFFCECVLEKTVEYLFTVHRKNESRGRFTTAYWLNSGFLSGCKMPLPLEAGNRKQERSLTWCWVRPSSSLKPETCVDCSSLLLDTFKLKEQRMCERSCIHWPTGCSSCYEERKQSAKIIGFVHRVLPTCCFEPVLSFQRICLHIKTAGFSSNIQNIKLRGLLMSQTANIKMT